MADKTAHTTEGFPRRTLLTRGLLLGAAATVGTLASGAITSAAKADTAGPQTNWGYCHLCFVLFFQPHQAHSACPVSPNGHQIASSFNYWLYYNDTVNESDPQSDWRWCGKCQGLFYFVGPNGNSAGWCPAGGNHVIGAGSFNYSLPWGATDGQSGWYWCSLCAGLFHGGSYRVAGVCPSPASATGNHAGTGSFNYGLAYSGNL
jgi:hypothetical protein